MIRIKSKTETGVLDMSFIKPLKPYIYAYISGFVLLMAAALIHFKDVSAAVNATKDNFLINRYLFIVIALLLITGAFLYIYKKIQIHKSFFMIVLALGMVYMQVFIGLSAPDEPSHYISAYKLSSQMLGIKAVDDRGYVLLYDDAAYLEDAYDDPMNESVLGSTLTEESLKLDHDWNENIKEYDLDKENTLYTSRHIPVNTSSLIYVPQAVGMSIARILKLSAVNMIALAKFFNLLLFALITAYSIKILPFGKYIVYAISLLPMTMHLAASMSYDALIIALYTLFVAKILALSRSSARVGIKDLGFLCLIIAVCGPCKIVYSLTVLLYFLIPRSRFKNTTHYLLGFAAVFLSMFVAMYLVNAATIVSYTSIESGQEFGNVKQSYGLIEVLTWPSLLIRMLYNTFLYEFDNYHMGFIGEKLGNLDEILSIPYAIVCCYSLGLTALALKDKNSLKPLERLWIVTVFLGVVFGLELSMLVAWTDRNSKIIEGVQGRYFIPIAAPLLMTLNTKYIDIKFDINTVVIQSFVFMQAYGLIRLFATVCLRIG